MTPFVFPPRQILADTGGTFTDCIVIDAGGVRHHAKVLSSSILRTRVDADGRAEADWAAIDGFAVGGQVVVDGDVVATIDAHDGATQRLNFDADSSWTPGSVLSVRMPDPAPVLAARLAMHLPAGDDRIFVGADCDVRIATTRGTNALLERGGTDFVCVLSRGFGDLLVIADQRRPQLFSLAAARPEPLPRATLEFDGRLASDGRELEPIDSDAIRDAAQHWAARGLRTAVVSGMNAWRNADHELAIARIFRECGFETVVCGSESDAFPGYLARTRTACVEAFTRDAVRRFVTDVSRGFGPRANVRVMKSSGAFTASAQVKATDGLLSGPAAGVLGAINAARAIGAEAVIGFDMGGTSTDVARWSADDDGLRLATQHTIGDHLIARPAVEIETVAAGGGSIADWKNGQLRVGPESAGAMPGPAAYGVGGPLTVTDVNLLLGRIDDSHFEIPIVRAAAEDAARMLFARIDAESPGAFGGVKQMLVAIRLLADTQMADAIRAITVRRGWDPRDHTLVAFGGAGGQHACAVARLAGMSRILVPAEASVLSAAGLGTVGRDVRVERPWFQSVSTGEDRRAFVDAVDQVQRDASAAAEHAGFKRLHTKTGVTMRLVGQSEEVDVAITGGAEVNDLDRRFRAEWERLNGSPPPDRPSEIARIRCEVREDVAPSDSRPGGGDGSDTHPAVPGPAILTRLGTSIMVEDDWIATPIDRVGVVLEHRTAFSPAPETDPVSKVLERDLFAHRLSAVATEMGEQVRRTSISTNVRERLDFSCAVFDAEGMLLADAPHVPVHLGALGHCVRAVRDAFLTDARSRPLGGGDIAITNHPAFGGSHLPDITLVAPACVGGTPIAWIACRAHHAEIGGRSPGSMPADATCLEDEGAVIAPRLIVDRGIEQLDEVMDTFMSARWPTRNADDNRADLLAQIGAVRRGVDAIQTVAQSLPANGAGFKVLSSQVLDFGEERVRATLDDRRGLDVSVRDELDDGTPIAVRVTIPDDPNSTASLIDFSGTGPVHSGNLNANPSIVHAVIAYVLRVAASGDLPLNDGFTRAIDVRIPTGLLAPPRETNPSRAPATVGGNVETSQRLADLLLEAFGLSAHSAGSMNNLLFGQSGPGGFGYYETIGGGSGAGDGRPGVSASHVHMTNTALTDPEILEHRYPVQVMHCRVRRESGGAGTWRGGEGIDRCFLFRAPLEVSVLTQRRTRGPRGFRGGEAGAPGEQWHKTRGGERRRLPSIASFHAACGDVIEMKTPGGGGWGDKNLVPR